MSYGPKSKINYSDKQNEKIEALKRKSEERARLSITPLEQKVVQYGQTPILIPLDKIVENPFNEKIFNMDITSIKEVIEEDGFRGAIEVYDLKDGTYEISSGHRRFRAALALGHSEILAFVFEKPESESEVLERLITSNLASRDLTPLEYANMIDVYMNRILTSETGKNVKGGKRKHAEERFGLSGTRIQDYLAILTLPLTVQKYAGIKDFPYRSLQKTKILDDAQLGEFVSILDKKISEEDIRAKDIDSIIIELMSEGKTPEAKEISNFDRAVKSIDRFFVREKKKDELIRLRNYIDEIISQID